MVWRNCAAWSLYAAGKATVVPLLMQPFPMYVNARRATTLLASRRQADALLAQWRDRRDEVLAVGRQGYRRSVEVLGLAPDAHQSVLADIDQDGFILSRVGPLENVPQVAPEEFRHRRRFDLQIVASDGIAAVRKGFRGDKLAFLRELSAAHGLARAGCNVPAILDIDFDDLALTFSFIDGDVLREKLAASGARLRDRDAEGPPTKADRLRRIVTARGRLDQVVDRPFVNQLLDEMRKAHAAGYILHDIKYGNVIIERDSGQPYLVDFDLTQRYPGIGRLAWRYLREEDYQKFNLHFGTDILTRQRIRQLRSRGRLTRIGSYAPIYIEGGLRFGNVWNIDVGYGRWQYFLRKNLLPFTGKRVLDLGANNGFNGIQMLRHGAREVVAIEQDGRSIEEGLFVKELFEWADGVSYNLSFIRENMANLPTLELGRFDVVTALCSIYYLDDGAISRLIRDLSDITNEMVLQCNTDRRIHRSDQHTFTKASVRYAVDSLRQNGFPRVEVVAPARYSRPLVVGRRS